MKWIRKSGGRKSLILKGGPEQPNLAQRLYPKDLLKRRGGSSKSINKYFPPVEERRASFDKEGEILNRYDESACPRMPEDCMHSTQSIVR